MNAVAAAARDLLVRLRDTLEEAAEASVVSVVEGAACSIKARSSTSISAGVMCPAQTIRSSSEPCSIV